MDKTNKRVHVLSLGNIPNGWMVLSMENEVKLGVFRVAPLFGNPRQRDVEASTGGIELAKTGDTTVEYHGIKPTGEKNICGCVCDMVVVYPHNLWQLDRGKRRHTILTYKVHS